GAAVHDLLGPGVWLVLHDQEDGCLVLQSSEPWLGVGLGGRAEASERVEDERGTFNRAARGEMAHDSLPRRDARRLRGYADRVREPFRPRDESNRIGRGAEDPVGDREMVEPYSRPRVGSMELHDEDLLGEGPPQERPHELGP